MALRVLPIWVQTQPWVEAHTHTQHQPIKMERPRSLLTKVCDLFLFVSNIWEEKVSCQVGHFECGDSQKFHAKAWQFHTTVAPAAVTTCPSSNLSKEKHSQLSVCKCLLFVRYVGPPFALLYLLGGTITGSGRGLLEWGLLEEVFSWSLLPLAILTGIKQGSGCTIWFS